MQIIQKQISDLKPYRNNPRVNIQAVDYVKESIEEFGFLVPLVIDRNNTIVTGHTRLLAAKELGMDSLPCVIADSLTEEQVKAFRLVDNKSSEMADWDQGKLQKELEELKLDFDFKIEGFDFDLPDMNIFGGDDPVETPAKDEKEVFSVEDRLNEGYYGDERERTERAYNLYEFDEFRASGKYQMPIIEPIQHIPKRLIGFNYVLSTDDFEAGVHFYLDDYQFERIWNNPHKYAERLSLFDCVLTPDFSLYMDMPIAMKVWNVYRSRLIGQVLQDYGCTVIPTVSWAEEETFEFCFDGLESGGVVSISTIGVKQNEEAGKIWETGTKEMIKRLEPSAIVVYGGKVNFDYGDVKVAYIENEVTRRMSKGR